MTSRAQKDIVLCINCGSSSLKFAVFSVDDAPPRALATGAVDRVGQGDGRAWLRGPGGRTERGGSTPDHAAALETAFSLLEDAGASAVTLVGHRIVHGGPHLVEPTRVDAAVIASLEGLAAIAPLHMPAAIAGIQMVTARHPELPQVACFDTAFHASMPEVARRLPLPDRFDEQGVRRYGFHGLSYEYVMSTLGPSPPARIVIAHLGNGSSLVAVRDGRGVDTTMGFTPAGGILMGTRTGDLDPGVLIYLAREKKLSVDSLERLVESESGLAAIGGTSDVKQLLERAATDPRARLALSMFGYAVRKAIGGLAAVLGGVDLLIFTGGIGEHAARIRADACEGLEPLGVRIDSQRNERGDEVISTDSSPCAVRVVTTNEDLTIARHAYRVVRSDPAP